MDALIPGLYIWFMGFCMRLGGAIASKDYPGTIKSGIGLAIVLPGYYIYSTYKGSYDGQDTRQRLNATCNRSL